MTAQTPDKINIDGIELNLLCNPLEDYFTAGNPRPLLNSPIFRTCCWRRYIAKWRIKNNKLYLVSTKPDEMMHKLFGKRTKPVFADWYSGKLRVGKGGISNYVHMGYLSEYSTEQFITIESGQVTLFHNVSNNSFSQNMKDLRDITSRLQDEATTRIRKESPLSTNSKHGIMHWVSVARYGKLISQKEEVNANIIHLFAYFHDSRRHSEGSDPEHGKRAAEYVKTFSGEELGLSFEDIERLIFACKYHTYEKPTSDLTILACWDADRLDLNRFGVHTDPKRLFTKTAKEIAMDMLIKGSGWSK